MSQGCHNETCTLIILIDNMLNNGNPIYIGLQNFTLILYIQKSIQFLSHILKLLNLFY